MLQPWNNLDDRAVAISRALAMDAVQKVGNGHPGTAMALAPVAYTLFQRIMKHDPSDPNWLGRDRFVLSAGHSSLTLYVQLFLSGYGLELSDLQSFRTAGSKTPGHPSLDTQLELKLQRVHWDLESQALSVWLWPLATRRGFLTQQVSQSYLIMTSG
jgi:transketolase